MMSYIETLERRRAYEVFKKREATKNVLPGEIVVGEEEKKKQKKKRPCQDSNLESPDP